MAGGIASEMQMMPKRQIDLKKGWKIKFKIYLWPSTKIYVMAGVFSERIKGVYHSLRCHRVKTGVKMV